MIIKTATLPSNCVVQKDSFQINKRYPKNEEAAFTFFTSEPCSPGPLLTYAKFLIPVGSKKK